MNFKNIFLLLLITVVISSYGFAVSEPYYLLEITGTNILPATIAPGDIVNIGVTVKDAGSIFYITNLKATLDAGTNFEPLDIEDTLASLSPNAEQTLAFKIKAKDTTLEGYYPVFLNINYERDGEIVSEQQNITITVSSKNTNFDLEVFPNIINPGSITDLNFAITNISGQKVSNIDLNWAESSNLILPLGTNNTKHIDFIDQDKTTVITFPIATDKDIVPGVYPLDITISFQDSAGTSSEQSTVGVIVGGETDFDISAEKASSTQITLSIANIGMNDAQSTIIKIPKQQNIKTAGADSAILGTIEKGDFTIASFETMSVDMNFQKPTTTGKTPTDKMQIPLDINAPHNTISDAITIEIHYTDTTGKRQIITKEVTLLSDAKSTATKFGAMATTKNSGLSIYWYIIILAALVGAYFGFKKYKKMKNKN